MADYVLTEEEEDLLFMTGAPGADRRRWLREHPDEQPPEHDDEPGAADA